MLGLKETGCTVIFASSRFTTREPWSEAAIDGMRRELCCQVRLHDPSPIELRLTRYVSRDSFLFPARLRSLVRKIFLPADTLRPSLVSIGMGRWFNRLVEELNPDLIVMNYAYFDCIVNERTRAGRKCIMEMHDLVTLNEKMQASFRESVGLERMAEGDIPEFMLDPDCYQNWEFNADPAEFKIYDKYDYTLCISEKERFLVQQHSPETKAVYLPMTQAVAAIENRYDGNALLTLGPNAFNLQGYYFFLNRVLPHITSKQPDFRLDVTGNFFFNFSPRTTPGIQYRGFVTDLRNYYESSAFFVCPVFGGTGQQVKVVEAMAHGLPVVALDKIATNSPIRHGVNGLIARCEEEFAHHVLHLWQDRRLCRRLGEEARRTVAAEFNPERLVNGLTPLLA